MHKYFIDWYKVAALQPTADELQKRWTALEGFNKKIKLVNALELVRLFYGLAPASQDFSDRYGVVFQAADPTFSVRNSELELRILSGAALAQIVEGKVSNLADAVALAMVTAYCRGLRKGILNSEIIQSARNYLSKESVRVRDIGNAYHLNEPDTDLSDLLGKLSTAAVGNNLAVLKDPLQQPLEKIVKAIDDLTNELTEITQNFENSINVHHEQSQILWWLFGAHSRDLNIPISKLPSPFAALVAGKELSDLVRLVPGPLAAQAFLNKMLESEKPEQTTTIWEAVNAASADWKRIAISERTNNTIIGDLCPLHLEIARSLQSDSSSTVEFSNNMEIKGDASISPIDLAMQFYDERMFIRAAQVVNVS